jgi:hypothetical protein
MEGLGSPLNREDSVALKGRECINRFVLTEVCGKCFVLLLKVA